MALAVGLPGHAVNFHDAWAATYFSEAIRVRI